ncbi:phage N-6-adenine-methyltransferase [Limnobaculum parvum]|uniref:Phage N-6-adenine-methyltransferase n=1 Tax=Limnobaculum parvum TaxID=2172103 RepID=A0A2Y9TU40_9GAMM|nr:phage N-6-adenine-methyltransferase [Limnobaculum parvum]AWH87142.1 phage N-6-adenine-methyltransferase [Limnobaculum parvum]
MVDFSSADYLKQIEILRSKSSHQLKDIGDQWCTPDALFWGIDSLYGPLVLDLFSDGENSKCPDYYTAADNALMKNWAEQLSKLDGAAFANPPYSRAKQHQGHYITGMSHIMRHTIEQRELGGRYVYLVKVATSEEWWPRDKADHIAFICGRILFDMPKWFIPAGKQQEVATAAFGVAILIFDKTWTGPPLSYVRRDDLLARGNTVMNMMKHSRSRIVVAV